MTFKYILPNTPADILASTGTDVFAVTIGSLVGASPTVIANLQKLAWAKYRNRPIGDYDSDYWLQALQDAVDINWDWYLRVLPEDVGLGSTYDMTSETTQQVDRAVVGANTGTATITNQHKSGTIIDSRPTSSTTTYNTSNPSGSTITTESEAHPDTAAGATKYLDGRTLETIVNTASMTGTVAVSATDVNTHTNTELIEDKTVNALANTTDEDVTTVTTTNVRNNLKAANFNKVSAEVRVASMAFVNALEPLFMNRY